MDRRKRVVAPVDAGMSRRAAADRFGAGVVSAIRFVQRSRERGDLTPDERGGNVRAHCIDGHADFILARLAAEPG